MENLERKSVKELRKMAPAYNISLPAGLFEKAAILQILYEGLTGSDPVSAARPDSPPSPPPAETGPRIRLQSRTGYRYWCAGVKLLPEWREYPVSQFTLSELEALRKDKHVGLKEV